jgi:hypothetical protein
MVSSEMLRRVALVRTDVSEEPSASFIMVTRISELGTMLAVTSNRQPMHSVRSPILVILMKEALSSSETSVLTRATRRNISEDTIFQMSICFTFHVLISSEAKSDAKWYVFSFSHNSVTDSYSV